MLANLNIARKLSLLLILPMATFLFLVTVESIERWKDIDELKFVERALVVSLSAGELIHELQKERGYTAGYLGITRLALMTATAMDQATTVLGELHNQTDILVGVMNDLNNTTVNKSIL